jgi:hypothetical protein
MHTMGDTTLLRAFGLAAGDFGLVLRGNDMVPCKLGSHG